MATSMSPALSNVGGGALGTWEVGRGLATLWELAFHVLVEVQDVIGRAAPHHCLYSSVQQHSFFGGKRSFHQSLQGMR